MFKNILSWGFSYALSHLTFLQAEANDSISSVLGDVSYNSAKIWAYAEEDEKLTVKLSPLVAETPSIVKSAFSSTSYFIEAEGLTPNTDYTYEVSINGKISKLSSGKFTTSPLPDEASKFSLAIISCLKKKDEKKIDWTLLEKENPDYLLMIGDNMYSDNKKKDSFETMRNLYLHFRKNKDFSSVATSCSTLAVWDDHDMGPDNSNGTLEGKEDSLRAFKDVWPNPSYGEEEIPGVFFMKEHGDVDIFMIDVRYHRESKRKEGAKMLGDEQFEWLIDKLKASRSPFKIIAGGSPIDHHEPKDGWERYPWARERLYRAIADNDITGVLFIGGDLHFSDLEVIPSEKTKIPYPIYNIVSSGFGRSATRDPWNHPRQKNPYVMMHIDTTVDDPTLEIEIKDRDKTYKEIVVKASELQ